MKKVFLFMLIVLIVLSLCGCHRMMGSKVLEVLGMEFTSQIEMIEECLSVDLDDLTDDCIETVYSYTDSDGNALAIQYIDLDGAGEYILNDITSSENWNELPYDDEIKSLLDSSGADEHFDFESIRDGYFTISGVSSEKDGFDFDRGNFGNWNVYEIGIWDLNAETLYFISITVQ